MALRDLRQRRTEEGAVKRWLALGLGVLACESASQRLPYGFTVWQDGGRFGSGSAGDLGHADYDAQVAIDGGAPVAWDRDGSDGLVQSGGSDGLNNDGGSIPVAGSGGSHAAGNGGQPAGGTGGTSGSGSSGAAGSGGTAGESNGGAAGEDSGPEVLWSHSQVTEPPDYLGAIATHDRHVATFRLDLYLPDGDCEVLSRSQPIETGWTGTITMPLTQSEKQCLREKYNCGEWIRILWGSCGDEQCSALPPGPGHEVYRPVCNTGIELSGDFSLQLTVAAIGPDGLDETWEIVSLE